MNCPLVFSRHRAVLASMEIFPQNVPYTESLRFAMSIHADSTSPGRRAPTIQNRKVPIRRTNAAYRSREYLAEKEVETLMESAASVGRHGTRDAALILVAYRHGLRVSELVSLRWDRVDLRQGLLHETGKNRGLGRRRAPAGPSHPATSLLAIVPNARRPRSLHP
jgi:integrase